MRQPHIEQRTVPTFKPGDLAWDIAHHLYTRQFAGKTIVIADQPFILLRIVRKQWLQLERAVQRERSRTLNGDYIKVLSSMLAHTCSVEFTAKPIGERSQADIFFVTPSQATQRKGEWATIYVAYAASQTTLQKISTLLRDDGLLVVYDSSQDIKTIKR